MNSDKKAADTPLPDFDALWDYNDPEGTEAKFRELLPEAEASGDRDHYLQLQTQIARTKSLRRDFDGAHALLDSVETALKKKYPTARVRYLLERGRTFNSDQKKSEASALFLQAYELAVDHHLDAYAVDAAHMLAISEPAEKQMEWNLTALELAEKSDDPKAQKWKGSLYNNIGWTFHDQRNYEQALKMFEGALAFREARADSASIFIAKWTIARTHRSLGDYEKALALQQELLQQIESGAAEPDGYVYEEIGEVLYAQGKNKEAQPYFQRAFELLSQDPWLVANEKTRLARLESFGKGKFL